MGLSWPRGAACIAPETYKIVNHRTRWQKPAPQLIGARSSPGRPAHSGGGEAGSGDHTYAFAARVGGVNLLITKSDDGVDASGAASRDVAGRKRDDDEQRCA